MNRYFGRIFVGCLLLGLFTSVNAAQPAETDSLPPARYALQFQLDQNFSFSSFEGSVLSVRQFRTGAPDRRWAVSVNGSITKSDEEAEHSLQTNSTTNENTITMNEINIRLLGQRIHSLYQRGPVTAYTAVGWTFPFGYNYQPKTTRVTTPDTSMEQSRQKLTAWNIGLGAQLNFGVEVAHNDWVYWFVEYGIRSEFQWFHDRLLVKEFTATAPPLKSTNTNNSFVFSLRPAYLTLGLAVMF